MQADRITKMKLELKEQGEGGDVEQMLRIRKVRIFVLLLLYLINVLPEMCHS